MALVFQRIARNLAKNGFYPTDAVTTSRILNALAPKIPDAPIRVLDPCCGEGVALSQLAQHLGRMTQTYGIEFDADRAQAARQRLTQVLWSDFQDTVIEQNGFELLFLNPPYGNLVSDRGMTGDEEISRFEELFLRRAMPALTFGGVLVFIIPRYELRHRICTWLAKSFERVQCWLAPDQTFQQAVIFGIRRRAVQSGYEHVAKSLMAIGDGSAECDELPEQWMDEPYLVPQTSPAAKSKEFRFGTIQLDPLQVAEIRDQGAGLWNGFTSIFQSNSLHANRPPARQVGDWHMALLIASGQINGLVEGDHGERLLLKGSTGKTLKKIDSVEFNEEGEVRAQISTITERFVPTIRAIDVSPTSPRFGDILIIQ